MTKEKLQHVRLSKKAMEIFRDKKLGNKIISAIIRHGNKLNNGGEIQVENIIIKSATND